MSAMLGITICFSRLSSDLEILALKAGGVSIYKIMPSVLIVSTLISLLTGYFSIQLIPKSELAMKQLSMEILKENITKGIKEHNFSDALGKIVIYIEDIDNNDQWHNVWISDGRQDGQPIITTAEKGAMTNVVGESSISVVLKNGSIYKPINFNKTDIIQFNSYKINLPIQSSSNDVYVSQKKVLSMTSLYEGAKDLKTTNIELSKAYMIEFHKRLTLPIGCFMLSFLALPLGLQARAGRKAIGIPVGLAIFVAYYILYTIGKQLAGESIPIVIAMWTPNVLFFLLAIFWTYRVSNEKELIPQHLINIFTGVGKIFKKNKA